MSSVPKVFISATSRDLRSYRLALRDALLTGGEVLPVIQEHFPPGYGAVRELLSREIGACEAVICLVGEAFGMAPQDRPERSYTQLEYDLARELQRRYYVFITADGWQPDEPPENSADQEDGSAGIAPRSAVRTTLHAVRDPRGTWPRSAAAHPAPAAAGPPAPDRPLAAVHSSRALADFTAAANNSGDCSTPWRTAGADLRRPRHRRGRQDALARSAWAARRPLPDGQSTSICSAQ